MKSQRIHLSRMALWLIALLTLVLTNAPQADEGKLIDNDYARVLSNYVNAEGLVDYKGLKANRASLDDFVEQMARLDLTIYEGWSREEKIALWINAYNVLTLKAIIDHYPVKSIKDIGSIFQSVWDKLKFKVMGREMTLNHIEHNILRERFQEPRIHLAINCASRGCPPLRREPFSGDKLEMQLQDQGRAFLADPSNFRIDKRASRVYLSSIFKWFGEDFVTRYGGGKPRPGLSAQEDAVLNYVSPYLEAQDREFLATAKLQIEYLDYDWGLNQQ